MPLGELVSFIDQSLEGVRQILSGDDDRLLVADSCSVRDPTVALEYGRWLAGQTREFQVDLLRIQADLLMVMRAHVRKPRTAVGQTGVVNDPHLDGSGDIAAGLHTARALLLDLATGVRTSCEWVDPRSTSYLADLVTWGAIGARTTGSQVHRHLASGLRMPANFKNAADGDVRAVMLEFPPSAVQARRSWTW